MPALSDSTPMGEAGHRIYMETYGCSANFSDSEIMAGLLKDGGFTIVNSLDQADVGLIVTCTVKTPTSQRMMRRIGELTAVGKPLVVAGCMTKTERNLIEDLNPNAGLVGPNSISKVTEVAEAVLEGRRLVCLEDIRAPKLGLPRLRVNPYIGIIEIASGCLSSCTFCQTKIARGVLASYPVEAVVQEASCAVREGCKEFWLTSQDNSCYGREIGASLPELIEAVCRVEGRFHVRVGMMNPLHMDRILDHLVKAYRNDKVFKFLHVPVQSGSDRILELMRRGYTMKEFLDIVARFREAFPDLTVSTDIIVGFPTEEEHDFEETLNLLERVRPDVVNISKYGRRPGTKAADMPQVDATIVKRRAVAAHSLTRDLALKNNLRWIGRVNWVLIDELGSGVMIGRNFVYKPVLIHEPVELGRVVDVEVLDATSSTLRGRILG